MDKKGFIFSFLLFVSCFFIIDNVKALTTLDNQTFPDFPNKNKINIIIKRTNNSGFALLEFSSGLSYVNNNVIYLTNNNSYTIYDLNQNQWIKRSYTAPSFSYDSIIASTGNIFSDSNGTTTLFYKGYNIIINNENLIFSDTSGYYKNNFYFNQSTFEYIWNTYFEGKSYNYYNTVNFNRYTSSLNESLSIKWKKEDFPNVACTYINNTYYKCTFYENLNVMIFSEDSPSHFSYMISNNYGSYPTFVYTPSSNLFQVGLETFNSFSFNNTYSSQWITNFDVINRNTGVKFKDKLFNYVLGPQIYNTNNIDSIEYKFDNIPLSETTINYDYTFKSVTVDGLDDDIDFSAPFGREFYTGCDDDGQNCTTEIKSKDYMMFPVGSTGHNFSGTGYRTFNSSSEHITNSYSVIIPFEYSMGSYVTLDFNSNYNYEMIIHYKDDEGSNNSFIDTVDLTGKYGAIFLPKYDNSVYADDDSYYLTNFRIVGNVDVQVTDSRDLNNYNILQLYSMNYCNTVYSEQSDIPYNCNNLSGIFSFKIDNLTANQTLRFVNHAYTESSNRRTLIEYDSRYFNYGILDEPTSVVQIEDPTTHVVETVGLSDFYNQFNDVNISNSKFTFKSAFNTFVKPIKFIFKTVSDLYNKYLSSSVQHYFFLVFSLMILMLLIRLFF